MALSFRSRLIRLVETKLNLVDWTTRRSLTAVNLQVSGTSSSTILLVSTQGPFFKHLLTKLLLDSPR